MIGRVWHGWTTPDKADAYEALLRSEVLPGIHRVEGYQGAYLFRRNVSNPENATDAENAKDEVEFMTLTLFDSLEAVKEFAGEDYLIAVVPPEARQLLSHFDATSLHYEMKMTPS